MKYLKNKTIWVGIFLLALAFVGAYGAKIVVGTKELYPNYWQPVVIISCLASLIAWCMGISKIYKAVKQLSTPPDKKLEE